MAGNNDACKTFMACLNTSGQALLIWEIPCISTENVSATQNKNQLPACRDDSSAIDNIESTSLTATGQIELIDDASEFVAGLIYDKACNCEEMCVFFLTPCVPPNFLDPNLTYFQQPASVDGIAYCGIPDANWTRDQTAKSLSFTISPTSGGTFGVRKFSDPKFQSLLSAIVDGVTPASTSTTIN